MKLVAFGGRALRTMFLTGISVLMTKGIEQRACALPPLTISADGRQLLKGGKPFFWIADTAWDIPRLDPTEIHQYMANRRAKGFNVIQGPIMHTELVNHFGAGGINATNPSAAWFSHIDTVIDTASAHNLYIAPVLTWGLRASSFNTTTAFNYGQYVGNRYRLKTNIAAFIIAGEFNFPAENLPIWDAMAAGLLAGLNGQPHLITMHPQACCVWGGQSSSFALHDRTWLSFNMAQSAHYGHCNNDPTHLYYAGAHNWTLIEHDWPLLPTKPTLDGEGGYEDVPTLNPQCPNNPNRWPVEGVRRRAYWSVMAGGFGYTYGANGVFQFNQVDLPIDDWDPNEWWDVAIDFPGATQMGYLKRLMYSRPIPGRVPQPLLLLAGATENVPQHPHPTLGAGGAYAMIYIPQTSKSVTVDMDLIAGRTHRFWWFIPSTGQAILIGEHVRADYAGNGGFALTTPATGDDFVLVIDNVAANFVAPGAVPLWRPGDVNGDESVNTDDLIALITAWGPCPAAPLPCLADLATASGGQGVINTDDLLVLIGDWGP